MSSHLEISKSEVYSSELSIELAVLQEDVELPSITLEPLTSELLAKHHSNTYDSAGRVIKFADPYFMPYQVCTNVIGNFYITMMFPLVNNGDSTVIDYNAPNSSFVVNDSLKGDEYAEQNFVSLIIPKYLAMNFYRYPDYSNFTEDGLYYSGEYKQYIPKGTKFIAGFIGGSDTVSNVSIIGIYGESLNVDDTILEV